MGRTACTESQCLYKGALYLFYVAIRFTGNPTDYKNCSNTPDTRVVTFEKTDIRDVLSVNYGVVTREMIHVPILTKSVRGLKSCIS